MEPNHIRPDDFGMIPLETLAQIDRIESDPRLYNEFLSDIEIHEPAIWQWLMASRMQEVIKISEGFPDIYNKNPCMPIYINGLMVTWFMRGFLLAQAKWRPEIIKADLSGAYEPRQDDFK